MKSKFKFALLITLILISFNCISVFGKEVNVAFEGEPIDFSDSKPFVDENNRILVPLRPVANALGLSVSWNKADKGATFSKKWTNTVSSDNEEYFEDNEYLNITKSVVFTPNSPNYYCHTKDSNGRDSAILGSMDTSAVIKDRRLYAPVRYIAHEFLYDTIWDKKTRTVNIVEKTKFYLSYNGSFDENGGYFCVYPIENISDLKLKSFSFTDSKTGASTTDFTLINKSELPNYVKEGITPILGFKFKHNIDSNSTYNVVFKFSVTKDNGAVVDYTTSNVYSNK